MALVLPLPFKAHAGNADKSGQGGATELLINPWARSSGWANANTASVRGLEATFLNVAGIAFTQKTELIFCRTSYLKGTDININAFGFTQKLGKSGVIGFNVMSMNFGEIKITTTDRPEGGIGTFSISYVNLGLSYSRAFSNNIYGGVNIKGINESLADASAMGVAVDAGIQYVTGIGKDRSGNKPTDNFKFGISMKNWGPDMRYRGDGYSFKTPSPSGGYSITVDQKVEKFELPLAFNIGSAYDYRLDANNRLTAAANFCSNSFSKDQLSAGIEYGFKTYFMIRAGMLFEQGIFSKETRTTALTGPTGGFTVEIPFYGNRTFGLDYSFRHTQPFQGIHSLSARINL